MFDLQTVLRNWKIMVPTSTATIAVLLWLLGIEFPRPVLASEYQSDLKTLNIQQLQIRKQFVEDKIERVDAELLRLKMEEWKATQSGQSIPPYLPELQQKVTQEKIELERTLDVVHQQEIELMKE